MKHVLCLMALLLSLSAVADSASERARKTIELTAQGGVFDYRMSPTQFAVMAFIDRDNQIGFKLGTDKSGKEAQTSVALQFKHYMSNTFYVAPEIFYLNTREDENWVGGLFGIPRKYAEYTSMGAGIRVGNQLTMGAFTLGVDWIGVGHRFGTFKKETKDLDNVTFTILNVIAGLSF